jgi:hypothetical protein
MDITKVKYMTTEVEEVEGGEEEEPNEEQEGLFDLPSTTVEAHTELLIDTTVTDKPSIIPVKVYKGIEESKLWNNWTSTIETIKRTERSPNQ